MKFRAKISNPQLISFHGTVIALGKTSSASTIVIFLTPDNIRFAAIHESIDATRCFAEISATSLCFEYKIESQSANTILFEVHVEKLSKILLSGKNSSIIQLKLVKRDNNPYLCFEAKDDKGLAIDIVHEIPIRLMKSSEISYFMPPNMPKPHVALEIPKTKLFRNIVDRLARFSKTVDIMGYQAGKLSLQVDHGTANIKTYYGGLNPCFEGCLQADTDIENKASVRVDVRRFSHMINFSNITYSRAVLCKSMKFKLTFEKSSHANFLFTILKDITDNAAVMIDISLAPINLGSLTYYSPVHVQTDFGEMDDDNFERSDDDNDER